MVRALTRTMLVATCLAAFSLAADTQQAAAADCGYPVYQHDLFYNYYVGPGYAGYGVPAQMYLSPRPTPRWVGHTYMTYQPLMPHELMYKHHRLYIRKHPDGNATRTKVTWY